MRSNSFTTPISTYLHRLAWKIVNFLFMWHVLPPSILNTRPDQTPSSFRFLYFVIVCERNGMDRRRRTIWTPEHRGSVSSILPPLSTADETFSLLYWANIFGFPWQSHSDGTSTPFHNVIWKVVVLQILVTSQRNWENEDFLDFNMEFLYFRQHSYHLPPPTSIPSPRGTW